MVTSSQNPRDDEWCEQSRQIDFCLLTSYMHRYKSGLSVGAQSLRGDQEAQVRTRIHDMECGQIQGASGKKLKGGYAKGFSPLRAILVE